MCKSRYTVPRIKKANKILHYVFILTPDIEIVLLNDMVRTFREKITKKYRIFSLCSTLKVILDEAMAKVLAKLRR